MSNLKERKLVYSVHTWDWKEQPDWESIGEAIVSLSDMNDGVKIIQVETGSDEFCVVIGNRLLTKEEAKKIYKEDTED